MSFDQDHAGARQQVADAGGVPTTFRKTEQAGHDPLTDRFSGPTTTTVSGVAVEVKGSDAEMSYERADLVIAQRIVLLFVPDVFGALPDVGSEVTWTGATFTVAERFPLRPDGTAILARILCVR